MSPSHSRSIPILAVLLALAPSVIAQQPAPPATPAYRFLRHHDPQGTGKFYMGREIAQVTGPGGIPWFERADREQQEHSADLLAALHLHPGQIVADIGAGSGYYSFRIARELGPAGKVLAVELQRPMLDALSTSAAALHLANVRVVAASEDDPHLAPGSIDLALFVDVYHELAWPYEVITHVRQALRPGGQIVFVEYRKEDPALAIKELHKMSLRQLDREMRAVGLYRVRTVESLPMQHIAFYRPRQH